MKEGFFGDGDHVATRTGAVVGTPQYISPEQALGRRGNELDGRADLYSLGVVLYEMVTGRLPFESDTAMGIILHHLQTLPTPPHELRPDLGIPEPLSAVLLRMLDKDRDRRFGTAADLIAALDGVLALPLPEKAEAGGNAGRIRRAPRHSPPRRVGHRPPGDAGDAEDAAALQHHAHHAPAHPRSLAHPPHSAPPARDAPAAVADPAAAAHRDRRAGPRVRGRRIPKWARWVGVALAAYFIFGRSTAKIRVVHPGGIAACCRRRAGRRGTIPRRRAHQGRSGGGAEGLREHDDEAIAVYVDDGEVTLTGHVHEREVAQEADRLARTVAGVTDGLERDRAARARRPSLLGAARASRPRRSPADAPPCPSPACRRSTPRCAWRPGTSPSATCCARAAASSSAAGPRRRWRRSRRRCRSIPGTGKRPRERATRAGRSRRRAEAERRRTVPPPPGPPPGTGRPP